MTATAVAPGGAPLSASQNPYVGPRSFRYGEPLYGRSKELGELLDLLVAQRVLLLYSPSGAGKTSLLEAGLRPALEKNDFFVLPTVRISHEPPPSFAEVPIRNRYVLSALLSLEEGRPAEHQLPPEELGDLRIGDYLARSADAATGRDPCLFLDQLEELFTLDPTDLAEKAAFLAELGDALRDRGRWALLAMREDFVAQLDPHLDAFSTLLRTRYRLDLLTTPAARAAIQKPAENAGIVFSDDAADRLVDDLRRVRVQRGSTVTEEPGPYVEPVQLQVVCRRLWARLSDGDASIELDDVLALGDVDNALADYYDEEVSHAAKRAGVAERSIRSWFDEELISDQGFRTQVPTGPGGDRSAKVLAELEDAHLIRTDRRRGAVWYELAHDRMIDPVRKSNAAWRDAHLSTLQREAQLWESQGRPSGLLLTGDVLDDAERWAEEHPTWLVQTEREYLDACREERRRAELERRTARRTRRLAFAAAGVSLLALAGLVAALLMWRSASHQRERADRQARSAAWVFAADEASDEPTRNVGWLYSYASLPPGEEANALLKRRVASVDHFLVTDPPYLSLISDLSPDGTTLVRGVEGGRAELIDLDTGKRRDLATGAGEVLDVEFGPDSDLIALSTVRDGVTSLVILRASDGERVVALDLPKGQSAGDLVFSRSPQVLAAVVRSRLGDEGGELRLWEMPSGRVVAPQDEIPPLSRVAVSRDGSVVAGVDADGLLVAFRRDGSDWTTIPFSQEIFPSASGPIELTPDGTGVVVQPNGDPAALVSLADGDTIELTAPGAPVQPGDDSLDIGNGATFLVGARFADDGELTTIDEAGTFDIWSRSGAGYRFESASPTTSYLYADAPLEFSDDGTRVLYSSPGYAASVYATQPEPQVLLGDDTGEQSDSFSIADGPTFSASDQTFTMAASSADVSFAWNTDPDERFVFGGTSDGTMWAWDAATGKTLGRPVELGAPINGFAFGPHHVAVVLSGALIVYPLDAFPYEDGAPTPDLDLQLLSDGEVRSVSFTDDGSSIELAEQDGSTSTLSLRPDYQRMAREALALAEARGLALSDEECRRLVHASCPAVP